MPQTYAHAHTAPVHHITLAQRALEGEEGEAHTLLTNSHRCPNTIYLIYIYIRS